MSDDITPEAHASRAMRYFKACQREGADPAQAITLTVAFIQADVMREVPELPPKSGPKLER